MASEVGAFACKLNKEKSQWIHRDKRDAMTNHSRREYDESKSNVYSMLISMLINPQDREYLTDVLYVLYEVYRFNKIIFCR